MVRYAWKVWYLMLTPYEESMQVNGGDNPLHWHSADRVMDHNKLQQLQQITRQSSISATTYTVTKDDDILLCSSLCTVSFPRSLNGREIEVVMTGTQPVTVAFAGTDTLYGETSALLEAQGTALRFKGISGGWILI